MNKSNTGTWILKLCSAASRETGHKSPWGDRIEPVSYFSFSFFHSAMQKGYTASEVQLADWQVFARCSLVQGRHVLHHNTDNERGRAPGYTWKPHNILDFLLDLRNRNSPCKVNFQTKHMMSRSMQTWCHRACKLTNKIHLLKKHQTKMFNLIPHVIKTQSYHPQLLSRIFSLFSSRVKMFHFQSCTMHA